MSKRKIIQDNIRRECAMIHISGLAIAWNKNTIYITARTELSARLVSGILRGNARIVQTEERTTIADLSGLLIG